MSNRIEEAIERILNGEPPSTVARDFRATSDDDQHDDDELYADDMSEEDIRLGRKLLTVRPMQLGNDPGSAQPGYINMEHQVSRLRRLLEAAEIQAAQIGTQARLISKLDYPDYRAGQSTPAQHAAAKKDMNQIQSWGTRMANQINALLKKMSGMRGVK